MHKLIRVIIEIVLAGAMLAGGAAGGQQLGQLAGKQENVATIAIMILVVGGIVLCTIFGNNLNKLIAKRQVEYSQKKEDI